MSSTTSKPEIIFFHYIGSPYGKKVYNYLTLRGLEYTSCFQPMVLPRPDLQSLGISYRRIPIMAIGRDVYCDTRIILSKLETLFPDNALIPSLDATQKANSTLLSRWVSDSVFLRCAALLPVSLPIFKDGNFLKDRSEYSGRKWDVNSLQAAKPESMAYMREAFDFLENSVLGDGREWALGTDKISMGDIEASWPFEWLNNMKIAFDPAVISPDHFPRTFAWLARIDNAVITAAKAGPKPRKIESDKLVDTLLSQPWAEVEKDVDTSDPLKLAKGDAVEVYPTDTGTAHHDRGRLVSLSVNEIVISIIAPAGKGKSEKDNEVRVHYPRTNFRVLKDKAKL